MKFPGRKSEVKTGTVLFIRKAIVLLGGSLAMAFCMHQIYAAVLGKGSPMAPVSRIIPVPVPLLQWRPSFKKDVLKYHTRPAPRIPQAATKF